MAEMIVFCDGSCVPNPGHGRFGVVVQRNGRVICRMRKSIGYSTCNEAEWRGALAALDYLCANPPETAEVRMDSQLVVHQLTGRWRVKKVHLKPYADRGRELIAMLTTRGVKVKIVWIQREGNREADRLTR